MRSPLPTWYLTTGTTGDSAFFENNDEMLLGRVHKDSILDRSAYQFFNGVQLDGTDAWTSDSTIATPVWSYPLMTSVQQANYHPGLQRYIFANWAWISYDGYVLASTPGLIPLVPSSTE